MATRPEDVEFNSFLNQEIVLADYRSESERPPHEGILLPDRWNFDSHVVEIKPKHFEPLDQWGNQVSRYRVIMSDGTKLGLNVCEPKERVTDIPVLETPAWFTNLHGFNEGTQRALGSLGFPSMLVGHIGQERDSAVREVTRTLLKPWETVRELRSISLARQAHNMLEVLTHQRAGFRFDTKNIFLHGNSRGGMTQFPLIALAQSRGINVVFAMPVAPCFQEGFNGRTMRELRSQLPNEAVNIGRIVARNLFDMAGSGLNTLNASPKALVYELAHGPALFSGEAGKFDDYISPDQHMLILAYESDVAGQKKKWEEAFANHPNVQVRGVPGAHLSIADRRTRAYVMRTFDRIGEQLHDGAQPEELDLSHIKSPVSLVKN